MFYLDLIQNVALLVCLVVIHGQIIRRWNKRTISSQAFSGFLFGCVALAGMMTPVHLMPGVIIDGRSIVLSVAGLFGGPITAGMAVIMSAAYRLWLGGPGAFVGVCVVLESAGLGVAFYYLRRLYPGLTQNLYLFGFCLLVHIGMLLLMLLLPKAAMLTTLENITIPVLLVFPAAASLICLLFLDQESRVSAEAALRKSEERCRTVADFTYDWEYWVGAEGNFLYVSPSCERITGYSAEEFIGDPDLMNRIIHPDDRNGMLDHYHNVRKLAPHAVESMDFRIIRRDGALLWIGHVCLPVYGQEGQLLGRRGSNRDITERKRVEKELMESEEKYRNLVEHISDVVFEIDNLGCFGYISPKLRDLAEYEPKDLIGRSFIKFVHPEDRDLLMKRFSELTKGDERPFDFRVLTKSGKTKWVRTQTKPFRKETSFLGGRGTLIDITERKRLEEDRMEMQHKLLQAQKLQSLALMAGGMAHDFNNQLAIVLGNLELVLRDGVLDLKARQKIGNAITAAKRSAGLSRQIQTYSGSAFYIPKDLDLNELAHKNEDQLKSAVSKTITLNFEIYKGLTFIRGDAIQIQSIITSLIMNASEAIGAADGDVTIRTGVMDCDAAYLGRSRLEDKPEPGRFGFLEVTDTGCGMDAETQRKLFDPFFSTKFWGRGLGMAEVMGTVKGHHGAIIVDSELGKGTTVRVLFPAPKEVQAEPVQVMDIVETQAQPSDVLGRRKTILVVDDEELVRELCVEWLELLGYASIVAVDGLEGVHIFRESMNEIDLVLLDFVMPRMNGVEAFEELVRIKPDVKVIFSSGYTEEVMRQRFSGRRPESILHKPYEMDVLKTELERLLGTEG